MSQDAAASDRADRQSASEQSTTTTDGTGGLALFRKRLDEIDDEIARLLGERLDICREVAGYKSEHGIPMMQPDRVEAVRARYLQRGAEVGLPEEFTARLFDLLIETTCRLEDELMDEAGEA